MWRSGRWGVRWSLFVERFRSRAEIRCSCASLQSALLDRYFAAWLKKSTIQAHHQSSLSLWVVKMKPVLPPKRRKATTRTSRPTTSFLMNSMLPSKSRMVWGPCSFAAFPGIPRQRRGWERGGYQQAHHGANEESLFHYLYSRARWHYWRNGPHFGWSVCMDLPLGCLIHLFPTTFLIHGSTSWNDASTSQTKSWAVKLSLLLGYTSAIKESDVWMHDHEYGWGGEVFLDELAKCWKAVLKRSNEESGIDAEYSRPGIICFLEQFKKRVEAINEEYDIAPPIRFNFQ